MYSAKTATSTLRVHIDKWHLIAYLTLALEPGREWAIQVPKVKAALALGYTLEELKAFVEKGVNLDGVPPRSANGVTPSHAANGRDNIPPFSLPIFRTFLVNFITANDQSLNVVECLEFRRLLLHLREDLTDKDIPHCTKITTEVIEVWKRCFDSLKRDLAVRNPFLTFDIFATLINIILFRVRQGTCRLQLISGPVIAGGPIWL